MFQALTWHVGLFLLISADRSRGFNLQEIVVHLAGKRVLQHDDRVDGAVHRLVALVQIKLNEGALRRRQAKKASYSAALQGCTLTSGPP